MGPVFCIIVIFKFSILFFETFEVVNSLSRYVVDEILVIVSSLQLSCYGLLVGFVRELVILSLECLEEILANVVIC
jgi:hypothetical protein